jgi:hypothetical protein
MASMGNGLGSDLRVHLNDHIWYLVDKTVLGLLHGVGEVDDGRGILFITVI